MKVRTDIVTNEADSSIHDSLYFVSFINLMAIEAAIICSMIEMIMATSLTITAVFFLSVEPGPSVNRKDSDSDRSIWYKNRRLFNNDVTTFPLPVILTSCHHRMEIDVEEGKKHKGILSKLVLKWIVYQKVDDKNDDKNLEDEQLMQPGFSNRIGVQAYIKYEPCYSQG